MTGEHDQQQHPTQLTPAELRIVSLRLEVLHGDVQDMRSVLKDLTSAITKLALIEERQTQAGQAQERAFTALEKVESRLAALEADRKSNNKATEWVDKVQWLALGALVMYVLKSVGIIGS